jgi:hypothetical protein
MAEEKQDLVYDVVIDHEIHGVTIEMIAWWGTNMDKGYPLWHPQDHISYTTVPDNYDVGIVKERIGDGPVLELRTKLSDVSEIPNLPIVYTDYVIVGGMKGNYLIHQYETTYYGVRGRSIMHREEGMPRQFVETFRKHCTEEIGRFSEFLPQLWKMWQVVKDPEINHPPRMRKVKKLPDGKFSYES